MRKIKPVDLETSVARTIKDLRRAMMRQKRLGLALSGEARLTKYYGLLQKKLKQKGKK